jgi:hypothetical protein
MSWKLDHGNRIVLHYTTLKPFGGRLTVSGLANASTVPTPPFSIPTAPYLTLVSPAAFAISGPVEFELYSATSCDMERLMVQISTYKAHNTNFALS